jgi:predicted RNA binding protein YcfA (HicA-like mRNA interferase family)
MKNNELFRILKEHGFVLIRNSGHMIYSNGTISVAVSRRNEYTRGFARRILQQMGLTKEQIKEII